MKRFLGFILAVGLMFSLTACGGSGGDMSSDAAHEEQAESSMTKEEMMEKAEFFDMEELYESISQNKVNAEETLKGKIFAFDGYVQQIESDYIIFAANNASYTMKISLSKDDILDVVTDQKVSIVGELTTVGFEEESELGGFGPISITGCEAENAYITNDTYEVSGELTFRYLTLRDLDGRIHSQGGQEDDWYFGLTVPDATVETMIVSLKEAIPVNHVPGQAINTITIDGTELKNGDNITISGKMKRGSMIDVKLVSVN